MTFTPAIISQAYRESNITAIGTALTTSQSSEGLECLKTIVSGVYGFEAGDPLMDWPIGVEGIVDTIVWMEQQWTYPPANVRFIAACDTAQEIYLLPNPSNGARVAMIDPLNRLAAAPITLNANGRAIEGAATVTLNTNGILRMWMYRSDRGEWVRLSDLTGDPGEVFPFPPEFDTYFITRLAMRLNPRYGRSLSDESKAALTEIEGKLESWYQQEVTVWGTPAVAALTWGYGDNRYLRSGSVIGDVGNAGIFGRRYRPDWMR